MNTFTTDNFLAQLRHHIAADATEETYRLDTISFVELNQTGWWQRSNTPGHVTASAWMLNATSSHALLLHHAKLDRWLQPGGHLDDIDLSPAHGALREAAEESGVASIALARTTLFDVDVHTIPARQNEPAHLHYDVRYLVAAANSEITISDESLGAKWIAVAEIANSSMDQSIVRLAKKTLLLELNT